MWIGYITPRYLSIATAKKYIVINITDQSDKYNGKSPFTNNSPSESTTNKTIATYKRCSLPDNVGVPVLVYSDIILLLTFALWRHTGLV